MDINKILEEKGSEINKFLNLIINKLELNKKYKLDFNLKDEISGGMEGTGLGVKKLLVLIMKGIEEEDF